MYLSGMFRTAIVFIHQTSEIQEGSSSLTKSCVRGKQSMWTNNRVMFYTTGGV